MFLDIIKLKKYVIFVNSYEKNQLLKMAIAFFVNIFHLFVKYLKCFVKKLKMLIKIEKDIIDFILFTFRFSLKAGYTL